MEYITEKDDKVKKVSKEEKSTIAKDIVDRFKLYDDARRKNLETAHLVSDEVYLKNEVKINSKSVDEKWKSTVKMCKLYMLSQILKAFIWKNVYSNTNSMFDVSGESRESDTNSNKQKTMLVDILEKMGYSKTCNNIITKSIIYGELISFTTWKKRTEEYRRPIEFFKNIITDPDKLPVILSAMQSGKKYWTDERPIYDNPYVYSVDPENFVFDSSQFDDFDNCPKIYRTFRTPYDIIHNKDYELTKDEKEEIKSLGKSTDFNDISNQDPDSLKDRESNGSTVEVLEHWGDITLPDGTILRNWYAVVIAGKYLVRFEKNPLIINPFSYGAFVTDPETKRGISLLYCVYKLALTQEEMLRKTVNIQSLNENPPLLSPQDFFKDEGGSVKLYPGKVVEYDANLYQTTPSPFKVESNVYKDDISYLDDLISEISGIFPNMAGASENDRTTATEISTKVEGQLTRLKMVLDVINQYLILENVNKVAKLCSNFKFGEEHIYINKDNNPEDVVINDEIRQADYRYTYADRSATSERFNYADMLITAVERFAKFVPLKAEELFTWYMEQKGVENPERFLGQSNIIPPEIQQAIMQNPQLSPIIQSLMERVAQAKQQQGGNNSNDSKPIPSNPFDNNEIHEQKEMEGMIEQG